MEPVSWRSSWEGSGRQSLASSGLHFHIFFCFLLTNTQVTGKGGNAIIRLLLANWGHQSRLGELNLHHQGKIGSRRPLVLKLGTGNPVIVTD